MIGAKLRELRLANNYTLKQMGEFLGVSHMTYQRYEKNDCDVSTVMLEKIADFYGVTADYLLGREPSPNTITALEFISRKNDPMTTIRMFVDLPEPVRLSVIDLVKTVSDSASFFAEKIKKSPPEWAMSIQGDSLIASDSDPEDK